MLQRYFSTFVSNAKVSTLISNTRDERLLKGERVVLPALSV